MFLVATPLVVTYLLNVMAGIGDSLTSSGKIDQPKTVIGNVNKCLTGYEISTKEYLLSWFGIPPEPIAEEDDCTTVGFGFIG